MSTSSTNLRANAVPQPIEPSGEESLRVLHLAIYPQITPMHGGQARARSIVDALKACGCVVETLGVYADFQFPPEQRGPNDVVISSGDFNDAYFAEPLFGDLAIASFLLARDALLQMAVTRIASFSPHLIFLEQPFLLPLVLAARQSGVQAKIVYCSQNDEAALKSVLVLLESGPGSCDHGLVAAVAVLERQCIAEADWVVSINDEEAVALRSTGVAAVHLPACSALNFSKVNRRRPVAARQPQKYIAYAASSYWLNVDGYFAMFGDGLGFLASDEQLYVLGSGCDAIYKDRRFERRRSINEARSTFHGFQPEDKLVATYLGAAAIIIPVIQGAGANLKTADALAAGRPVISTTKGLAGYRSILGDALGDGVYEAGTPLEFKRLMKEALSGKLRCPPAEVSARFQRDSLTATVGRLLTEWSLATGSSTTKCDE